MAGNTCMSLRSSSSDVVLPNCRRAARMAASAVMPSPPIALRQQSDVFLDLVLELEVAPFIANRATDPRPQFSQPADHDFSLANRSTRPITPEIRSQSSVSFASCFRPLFVIE